MEIYGYLFVCFCNCVQVNLNVYRNIHAHANRKPSDEFIPIINNSCYIFSIKIVRKRKFALEKLNSKFRRMANWFTNGIAKELKTRSFTRPSSPCLCNYSAARNICAMSAIDVLFMSDRNINASTGIILALLWIVRIDWICTEKVAVQCAVMVYTRVAVFESLNY